MSTLSDLQGADPVEDLWKEIPPWRHFEIALLKKQKGAERKEILHIHRKKNP